MDVLGSVVFVDVFYNLCVRFITTAASMGLLVYSTWFSHKYKEVIAVYTSFAKITYYVNLNTT